MNIVQIVSLARMLALFFGGLAVGKGWISQDQVDSFTDPVFLTQVVGGAVAVGAVVWGLYQRRPAGLLQDAASLSEVKSIDVKTVAMAKSVPSNKVQATAR